MEISRRRRARRLGRPRCPAILLAGARTLLTYGFLPGTALLEVSDPQRGVADTLVFSAVHGAPARLSIAPAGTSMSQGSSYTLRATVADQYSNPIADLTPSFSATGATVSPTGQVTVPNGVTRGRITVSYAGLSDTAGVSVVPVFPMIIVRSGKLGRIDSDGSGSTTLTATPYSQLSPSSVPTTPSVVFYEGFPGSDSKVWVVRPDGTPQPVISGATSADAWPRLSPDGACVYFVRNLTTLWRVKLDGTGLDSLTSFTSPLANVQGYDSAPTISPDGRSVAIGDGNAIKIIDVATKASRILPVTCGFPRYSPDGGFFACASQADVSIVGTDGTGQRVVAQFQDDDGPDMYSGVDWSPDGKWLVMMPRVMLPAILMEVSTGTKIPLTGLGGQYSQRSFVR